MVEAEGGQRISCAQKFKMAEPSDNPCSSSSEDDEYSDPLEVAAAGAGLSTPEKAGISRKRKVQTYPNVNIAGNGFIIRVFIHPSIVR